MTTRRTEAPKPFRRLAAAGTMAAAFLGTTMLVTGPASAEPYGTRTCNNAPPLVSCTTGSLEPHSSEKWLEVKLNPSGSAICHVRWDLYDVTNNWTRSAGGTKYLSTSSTTFKVYSLNPSHYYRLEATSNNCMLSIRLRNWT
ncbi:hypothetical protein [Microtetraspora niveoalba]|uniref:hypothetical protein n=1 Tax=Microtetraspora niveoalba TaxID=46175 RepID=UPI000836682F|nr:hypothetical protein [Microtetraspora niveoalba]